LLKKGRLQQQLFAVKSFAVGYKLVDEEQEKPRTEPHHAVLGEWDFACCRSRPNPDSRL